MRRIRNISTGLAIASLAMGGVMAATPASAATAPTTSVKLAPTAKLGLQGLAATLKVTYRCPDGATAMLGAILKQPVHRSIAYAYGTADATCDGVAHVVALQVSENTLTFKPGLATGQVTIGVNDPSTAGYFNTTTGLVPVTLRK